MSTANQTASSGSVSKVANSRRGAGRAVSTSSAMNSPKRASGEPAPSKVDVNELAAPTQPLATVKARFSEFVDRVHKFRERIVVTRNGVPVAVLIDPDELFSIEETLDLLNDAEAMEALAASKSANRAGAAMTSEEFIAHMERALGPRPR